MRAYRPSYFSDPRAVDEQDVPRQKLANFRRYCRLVRQGLRLFEEAPRPESQPKPENAT